MKMGMDLMRHPVCDNMPRLYGFVMQYSMGGISGIYRIGYKKSHDQQGNADKKSVDGPLRSFGNSGHQADNRSADLRPKELVARGPTDHGTKPLPLMDRSSPVR
ncbi:MAG: hypothetical protein ACYCYL_13120 [Acidithiobacillus sp.]